MPSDEAMLEAAELMDSAYYSENIDGSNSRLDYAKMLTSVATLVDRKNNTIIRQAEDIAEGLKRHVIPLDKKIGELRTDLKKLKKEVRHED